MWGVDIERNWSQSKFFFGRTKMICLPRLRKTGDSRENLDYLRTKSSNFFAPTDHMNKTTRVGRSFFSSSAWDCVYPLTGMSLAQCYSSGCEMLPFAWIPCRTPTPPHPLLYHLLRRFPQQRCLPPELCVEPIQRRGARINWIEIVLEHKLRITVFLE